MSWKIRTDSLVTPFLSFHNLENLDRMSRVHHGQVVND